MDQISVLFIDSHPLIRKAWKYVLGQASCLSPVEDCANIDEAIPLLKQKCFDIVIVDIRLRSRADMEVILFICQTFPFSKVIALSFDLRLETAEKMLQNGAKGYLTKISPPSEIYKAIEQVYQGETYICPEIIC